jgi:hypothetical protein
MFRLVLVALAAALASSQTTTVLLSPALVTASNGPNGQSSGVGIVDVTVDAAAKTVNVKARLYKLSSALTVAHFHGPADIGFTNSSIVTINVETFLSAAGQTITGVSDANLALILGGKTYINVHTASFGSGEISGPVAFEGTGVANLMPSQETTMNTASTAYGMGLVSIDATTNLLSGSVRSFAFGSSVPSAIHIHGPADIGANANVWCSIVASPTVTDGTVIGFSCPVPVDATIRTDLYAGRYYFNVHTDVTPAGEIRGQIIFPSTLNSNDVFVANITGLGVEGRVSTSSQGQGSGMVVFYQGSTSRGVAALSSTGLSSSTTNAHIHGAGGGVVLQLPQMQLASTFQPFSLSDAAVAAIRLGASNLTGAYFNVHTTTFTSGEINGYIKSWPRPVAPVVPPASGAGSASVSLVTLALAAVVSLLAFTA